MNISLMYSGLSSFSVLLGKNKFIKRNFNEI